MYTIIALSFQAYCGFGLKDLGSFWTSLDFHGRPWTSVDAYEICPCVSTDVHERPWKSKKFLTHPIPGPNIAYYNSFDIHLELY